MFELCDSYPILYIPFSYLIVKHIIKKMDSRNEENYTLIIKKLMVSCSIFNISFYSLYYFLNSGQIIRITNVSLLMFCGSILLFLYIIKPKKETIKRVTENEIKKYFDFKNIKK